MRQRVTPLHRNFARALRADATRAEGLLWQQLRGNRMQGFRFRRQVPLDGYILDFICFEARLIVEVDGWQHAESARDARRDAHFRDAGFTVLRFWNDEITDSLDAVCRMILLYLPDPPHRPPPLQNL